MIVDRLKILPGNPYRILAETKLPQFDQVGVTRTSNALTDQGEPRDPLSSV
jgi:hypothetical protein